MKKYIRNIYGILKYMKKYSRNIHSILKNILEIFTVYEEIY
jgi:hypothetical protein